ncbi:hypothetical protein P700755_002397 [Psychroflexus torquis ATCC 700755]|uniref:Uncharacterized protein n=1 Tax=Psychroflexus torquis (strain ATCC 700755 / CIP 106069 / ACAM 623) TaxID=313595 RepID=K4IJ95_PSYTT|nr:hypothetical protein [Psychroflexus torquis]AFU69171.1 hypothetical protein P700755_002397 [Psychroflexus torquis ATCC 700755]
MKSSIVTDNDGNKFWMLPNTSMFHREDGPAVEYANGDKYWFINDVRHREDGPAIENFNGVKWWYLNGKEYTEQEHKFKMRDRKLKELLQ